MKTFNGMSGKLYDVKPSALKIQMPNWKTPFPVALIKRSPKSRAAISRFCHKSRHRTVWPLVGVPLGPLLKRKEASPKGLRGAPSDR